MGIRLNRKDKRIVLFVTKISGIETVVKRKAMKPHEENIQFRGGTSFPFDINQPAFRNKQTFYYLVNIHTGQKTFDSSKIPISIKLFDMIMRQEIVAQIVGALKKRPMFENIIMVLMGIGMGAGIGYIIGNFLPMTGV